MTTVAVVVSTYNGAAYLGEQLASILAQSRQPDLIIVTDDESSDDTVAIARAALAGFDGDTLITTNPGARGVVPNFSHGLAAAVDAGADLIALSDQDDIWRPDKLRELIAVFEDRPGLQLLHSDARLVDAQGAAIGGTLLESISMSPRMRRLEHDGRGFSVLLRRNTVTGATSVVRRGLVQTALPVPPGWVHDEWLAIVAAATGRFDLVELPLVDYRQHGANEIGAALLGVGGKARRMAAPRAERNARLLTRAEQLPARLEALGSAVDPALTAAARAKLAHEQRRSALPAGRLGRIPGVFGGLLRGDYRRFGRGVLDAVRDLVQPA